MFANIQPYSGDPILSLMEIFQQDSRTNKTNLGIGFYYDQNGVVPRLTSVLKAQQKLASDLTGQADLYLPMDGLASYNSAVQNLLFDNQSSTLKQQKVATIQSIGGSGALKLGAEFLNNYFPNSQVWVSQPTWENHIAIFTGAGFKVNYYPYFNQQSLSLDFDAMLSCLKQLPTQSIVLLHPCCHNPTGVDLTQQQWDQVIAICKQNNLIAFFDLAYQGLAQDLVSDVYAIRTAADLGVVTLVANSFSKIFSLYASRVGALSIVCTNKEQAQNVLGQLKAIARKSYSVPPIEGAKVISQILNNTDSFNSWQKEVKQMQQRILTMRQALFTELTKLLPKADFFYLINQKGMFSYTGFNLAQIKSLRKDFAVYLIDSGRMCVAGLNPKNINTVAQAFAAIYQN